MLRFAIILEPGENAKHFSLSFSNTSEAKFEFLKNSSAPV